MRIRCIYLLIAMVMVGISVGAALSGYVSSDPINLKDGETNDTIDFGFYRIGTGKIGNFVWNDVNEDGIQDPGEPGINGVTVHLLDVDKNECIAETTTKNEGGIDGIYWFTDLKPGNYSVVVDMSTLPPEYEAPSTPYAGSDRSKDSDTVHEIETNPCG